MPREPCSRGSFLLNRSRSNILRWKQGETPQAVDDALATEEPLEIRIDNHPISVTMRTPGADEELAVGFLLAEGLIHRREDVHRVVPHPQNPAKNVINVFLSRDVNVDLKRLTRHVFASSSCGLCGKTTIESVQQQFPPINSSTVVSAAALAMLPGQLRNSQKSFSESGGLHAAGIFTVRGDSIVLREDVGRHNAVDKVLGYGFLKNLRFDDAILLVSGRASFEIMQKALAARIPIVAAISAPSSLAVDFATANGQTLVGFLRDGRMNVYTEPQRICF